MTTPVKFGIAKLLKVKGFNEKVRTAWYIGEIAYWKIPTNHNESNVKISAPTIGEVVMWLYEEHGIWISVDRVVIGSDEWEYGYVISYLPKEHESEKRRSQYLKEIESYKEGIGSYVGAWRKPTEAYESAILYCLTKLI